MTSSTSNSDCVVYAIIPAAGVGSRMEGLCRDGDSKVFLSLLDGRSVLECALQSIVESQAVKGIVLVVRPEEVQASQKLLSDLLPSDVDSFVVIGGSSRQESVGNGINKVVECRANFVLVHDAARPLCPPELIRSVVRKATSDGAAILAVPVKSTIKSSGDDLTIAKTLSREHLWEAQTPQVFSLALLKKAHEQAIHSGYCGTDESELVERIGAKVSLVRGTSRNLKITTPEDLEIASALLLSC